MSLVTGIRRVGAGSAIEVSLESGERLRVDERRLLERELAPGVDLGRAPLARLREWQRIDGAEWRMCGCSPGARARGRSWPRRAPAGGSAARSRRRCSTASPEPAWSTISASPAGLPTSARRQAMGGCGSRTTCDAWVSIRQTPSMLRTTGAVSSLAPVPSCTVASATPPVLDRRARARAAGHLGRRGFDVDTVSEALGLDPGC